MTDYLTEQEQVELLKKWIKQYSPVVILGVALAIITSLGMQWWHNRQIKTYTHASHIYDEMLNFKAQNNLASSLTQAERLITRYPNTIYAPLASLFKASAAIKNQQFKQAEADLNWAIEHSQSNAFTWLAKLRLARVLIAEANSTAALKLLEHHFPTAFNPLRYELQGDAYLQTKQLDKARSAYQAALKSLPNAASARPLLLMKFQSLANAKPVA